MCVRARTVLPVPTVLAVCKSLTQRVEFSRLYASQLVSDFQTSNTFDPLTAIQCTVFDAVLYVRCIQLVTFVTAYR